MSNSVEFLKNIYIIPNICWATLEENKYDKVFSLYVQAYQLNVTFPQYLVKTPLLHPSHKYSW